MGRNMVPKCNSTVHRIRPPNVSTQCISPLLCMEISQLAPPLNRRTNSMFLHPRTKQVTGQLLPQSNLFSIAAFHGEVAVNSALAIRLLAMPGPFRASEKNINTLRQGFHCGLSDIEILREIFLKFRRSEKMLLIDVKSEEVFCNNLVKT